MAERRLTVSTLREPRPSRYAWNHKPDRAVPFLPLAGPWLREAGFSVGSEVRVAVVREGEVRVTLRDLDGEGA